MSHRPASLPLLALVLTAAPIAGCSPLLYALLSLRGSHDSGTELQVGRTVQGSTDDEASSVNLTCGSPEGAGDESWTFVPPTAGPYRFTAHGEYDCALGLFGPDDPRRELACNDDSGSNNVSVVVANLEAGRRYVVVVDGYRGNEGSYQLTAENAGPGAVATPSPVPPPGTGPALPAVAAEDQGAMQARCDAAPILGAGTTSGHLDPTIATARTSCGSGPGGDVLYRLVVPSAARVTLELQAVFDGILELRAACSGGRVLACNDDSGDATHSQVAVQLPAGTYFVVVDSYDPRNAGPFSLQVILQQ